MPYKLDIFRMLSAGQFVWLKAVNSLDEAMSQVSRLIQTDPGDYFLYDTRSGRKIDLREHRLR